LHMSVFNYLSQQKSIAASLRSFFEILAREGLRNDKLARIPGKGQKWIGMIFAYLIAGIFPGKGVNKMNGGFLEYRIQSYFEDFILMEMIIRFQFEVYQDNVREIFAKAIRELQGLAR
jgi:hypothetical protein